MEFITIILAWVMIQYWGSASPVHQDGWFDTFISPVRNLLPDERLAILTAVLVPALLVTWVLGLFDSLLFGLPYLILHILVLLYCLGRGDFSVLIQQYRERWQSENFQSAYRYATTELGIAAAEDIDNVDELHQVIKRELMYQGFQRWFAVVFWFFVAGIFGALVYRLLHLYKSRSSEGELPLVVACLHALDWIPVRILALAFAVTGDFVAGIGALTAKLFDWGTSAGELICDAANASLQLKNAEECYCEDTDELGCIQGLLSRSMVTWIVMIALITLLA